MKLAEHGLKKLIPQILLLLDNRIYHKDLHPGNVLIDKNNRIFIIDFDKAGLFRGDRQALLNIYLERWKRAVIKHNLPEAIYDTFYKELVR
jgi:3-deoxy-D-manno-octulosonic acid kinase